MVVWLREKAKEKGNVPVLGRGSQRPGRGLLLGNSTIEGTEGVKKSLGGWSHWGGKRGGKKGEVESREKKLET